MQPNGTWALCILTITVLSHFYDGIRSKFSRDYTNATHTVVGNNNTGNATNQEIPFWVSYRNYVVDKIINFAVKVKEKELKALEWSLLEREVNLAVRQKEIKKMTKAIEEKREINVSEREKACAEKEAWIRELTAEVTQLDEKPLEGKND